MRNAADAPRAANGDPASALGAAKGEPSGEAIDVGMGEIEGAAEEVLGAAEPGLCTAIPRADSYVSYSVFVSADISGSAAITEDSIPHSFVPRLILHESGQRRVFATSAQLRSDQHELEEAVVSPTRGPLIGSNPVVSAVLSSPADESHSVTSGSCVRIFDIDTGAIAEEIIVNCEPN